MAGPDIGVQFKCLPGIRSGFVQVPHVKLSRCEEVQALSIERIQIYGSALQLKRFVQAAENGCRLSHDSYNIGICWFERNRALKGGIRSSPVEVGLLLDPPPLN